MLTRGQRGGGDGKLKSGQDVGLSRDEIRERMIDAYAVRLLDALDEKPAGH